MPLTSINSSVEEGGFIHINFIFTGASGIAEGVMVVIEVKTRDMDAEAGNVVVVVVA